MAIKTHKRFYTTVDVRRDDDGWTVLLDDRPVKTPAGRLLVVPTQALAQAVAQEWDAQQDDIRPDAMAHSQLAITAQDRMCDDRDAVVAALSAFAASDLLCYRADAPETLVARQAALWQPPLDWAEKTLQARLAVTTGVLPIAQDDGAVAALGAAVADVAPWGLAVLGTVTPATGSLVLGLAHVRGDMDMDAVIEAAFVDETFQAERWGADEEAEARRQGLEADLRYADDFLRLLREDV